jgi:hypothetical protein
VTVNLSQPGEGVWEMIGSVVDLLFGCWHRNYSFPRSARGQRRSGAAAATGTYVVCLDCGKEFPYDWQKMKVVASSGESERQLLPNGAVPKGAESLAKVA